MQGLSPFLILNKAQLTFYRKRIEASERSLVLHSCVLDSLNHLMLLELVEFLSLKPIWLSAI